MNLKRIVFTTNDGCLSQVSPMIVTHERSHLVLARYYGLNPGIKNMPENTRLEKVLGFHESNGNLYSSADVIFNGGKSVSLNNDFYATASTNFEAYIANCPDFPDSNKGSP